MDLEVVEKVENDKSGLEIAFNKDQDNDQEEIKQAPKMRMEELMPDSDSDDDEREHRSGNESDDESSE